MGRRVGGRNATRRSSSSTVHEAGAAHFLLPAPTPWGMEPLPAPQLWGMDLSILHPRPSVNPVPQHRLEQINNFLDESYALQQRAHRLLAREHRELHRGIHLNILSTGATSDGSPEKMASQPQAALQHQQATAALTAGDLLCTPTHLMLLSPSHQGKASLPFRLGQPFSPASTVPHGHGTPLATLPPHSVLFMSPPPRHVGPHMSLPSPPSDMRLMSASRLLHGEELDLLSHLLSPTAVGVNPWVIQDSAGEAGIGAQRMMGHVQAPVWEPMQKQGGGSSAPPLEQQGNLTVSAGQTHRHRGLLPPFQMQHCYSPTTLVSLQPPLSPFSTLPFLQANIGRQDDVLEGGSGFAAPGGSPLPSRFSAGGTDDCWAAGAGSNHRHPPVESSVAWPELSDPAEATRAVDMPAHDLQVLPLEQQQPHLACMAQPAVMPPLPPAPPALQLGIKRQAPSQVPEVLQGDALGAAGHRHCSLGDWQQQLPSPGQAQESLWQHHFPDTPHALAQPMSNAALGSGLPRGASYSEHPQQMPAGAIRTVRRRL